MEQRHCLGHVRIERRAAHSGYRDRNVAPPQRLCESLAGFVGLAQHGHVVVRRARSGYGLDHIVPLRRFVRYRHHVHLVAVFVFSPQILCHSGRISAQDLGGESAYVSQTPVVCLEFYRVTPVRFFKFCKYAVKRALKTHYGLVVVTYCRNVAAGCKQRGQHELRVVVVLEFVD